VSPYGQHLPGAVRVKIAETGTVLPPVQQDPAGQFLYVRMPSVAPGTRGTKTQGVVNYGMYLSRFVASGLLMTEGSAYPSGHITRSSGLTNLGARLGPLAWTA